ncbi:MAG: hypothetical protein RMI89_11815 [Gloeomargarita sp. SKYBB_i_bin120]|nr:hypothetical protein [Gloeomargarita sp. SKYG98]MCS7293632.1 hypothetical protein [Gloeomargarita sp. SKYB120]MDW8179198.1 hypothetical protein [Gloeomargarita sp. SKYBB_i_bin120]
MLTLEQRFQGCLLGTWLAWQLAGDLSWSRWLDWGCRYWTGQTTQAPVATVAEEALLLLLPGLLLSYPNQYAEVVAAAGLPEVVQAWAIALDRALRGQVGEPLAETDSWPELAQSVADFHRAPDDPEVALTWANRQGRSAFTLGLTGWLLGAYGGATAFPAHWVVRLPATHWRDWGTALLARWAGVRNGTGPWAVQAKETVCPT